jgi:hypothetical protein
MAIQVPTGQSRHPGAFGLLTAAIRAVPAVKFALGVAGVAAALALATSFFGSAIAALVGSVAMVLLMTLLVIFAAISQLGPELARAPALLLTWFVLILTCFSSGLTISSIFFDWPKPFPSLVTSLTIREISRAPIPPKSEVETGEAAHAKRRAVSRVLAGARTAQPPIVIPNCPVSELCQELEVKLASDSKILSVLVQAKDSDAADFTVCKPESHQSFIECGTGSNHLDAGLTAKESSVRWNNRSDAAGGQLVHEDAPSQDGGHGGIAEGVVLCPLDFHDRFCS